MYHTHSKSNLYLFHLGKNIKLDSYIRIFIDGPYMLLGNMYKTFTKLLTISHDEESLRVYKSRSICGYIISPCDFILDGKIEVSSQLLHHKHS